MKLQKLTIHNIASIEDAEINFEADPLAGSDVFLITGDTGSGKSTILDAICLALYADTPRLDNTDMEGDAIDENGSTISVGDTRQLLRRNTGEGHVELTFIGNNGKHYKTKWEVHRKSKKVDGPLQGSSWSLTKLDENNEVITAVKKIEHEITEVVGLTFDQFCRTTLLAQGEFTRFLDSKNKEKADILEKITGTDIYKKIGKKIHEITADKKTQKVAAENAVGNATFKSQDALDEMNAKIKKCEESDKALTAERDAAKNKLQWLTDEKSLNETYNDANKELTTAKEAVETDEFKEKELEVKQWNATIAARGWLAAHEKAEGEKASQSGILNGLKADYLGILAGQAFEEQKRQQTLDALNKLPQVDANDEKTAQDKLTDLRKQFNRAKGLEHKIGTLEREIELRQQASRKLAQALLDIEGKKKAAEKLNPKIDEAQKVKDDREKVYEKQKETVEDFAKLMRQKLQVGDTCPVCGQKVTGELPHEEELAELVKKLSEAFTEAKNAYDGLVGEKTKLLAEKEAFEKAYSRDKEEFDKNTSVADALQRVNEACKDCGIEVLDESTMQQRLQTLKVDNAEAIRKLNEDMPVLEKKVEAYSQSAEERTRLTRERDTIDGILSSVKTAVEGIQKDMPDWKALKPAAAAKMDNLSTNASDVRTKVHTAATQLGKASRDADDNEAPLKQFLAEHPELTRERLAALNKISHDDFTKKNDEVNDARAAVSRQKGALQQAKDNYEKHLGTKPELKEEDTIDQLEKIVSAKEGEMKAVNTEKGQLQQALQDALADNAEYGKLVEEKDRLEADYNKWNRLRELLGDSDGAKFNKIAQSYILGSLIHSANHYMQNLYDRYTLKVVPGTFVIMIEDAYQGFASRAVSTISGGESFLVSLALALALSDIGDRLAVDTLFIDEGFGTLSGKPLENAIGTLRTLHNKVGRHVGIISHIEELRESIATQIQVTQSPNTGSSYIEIHPQ